MAGRSDVVNTLEENLSGIKIASFDDTFLGKEVPRFIESEVNADKGVDLIGRLKPSNVTEFANNACGCRFCDTRYGEDNLVFW